MTKKTIYDTDGEWHAMRWIFPKMPDAILLAISSGGGLSSFCDYLRTRLKIGDKEIRAQLTAIGDGLIDGDMPVMQIITNGLNMSLDELAKGGVSEHRPVAARRPKAPPARPSHHRRPK